MTSLPTVEEIQGCKVWELGGLVELSSFMVVGGQVDVCNFIDGTMSMKICRN